jgi:hypothetical protein
MEQLENELKTLKAQGIAQASGCDFTISAIFTNSTSK